MAGKIVIAEGICPKCGDQMTATTHGNFYLACGYVNYGSRSEKPKGEKISHRDVKEIKDGKKRDI